MSKTLPRRLEVLLSFTGPTLRCDCPICGGINTFSARKDGAVIRFGCFRASCKVGGTVGHAPSVEDLNLACLEKENENKPWPIPAYFSNKLDERCMEYLEANHCLRAYREGLADVMYDPRQDRVCFMIVENGECYGASGRALYKHVSPKWYVYGNGGRSLFVGGGESSIALRLNAGNIQGQICIVEDCASACAVSGVMDAIALLGTNLHERDYSLLRTYDTVYVALDKDATKKALEIQKNLSYITRAVVVPLEKDLKYLETSEIEQVIYGADCTNTSK